MRLVVIGGNAAGLSAASRARRLDRNLDITVLESGPHVSAAVCGLPYFVEGCVESTAELQVYTPEYFARERSIDVRPNSPVAGIAPMRREVALASGERVPFDRLVIATGARTKRTGIAGVDQPHVFRLQTLTDGERLREYLQASDARNAVIVGAGYIGLEMAGALRARGLSVTIFQPDGTILGRTEEVIEGSVVPHLERFGVALRRNEPVRAIGAHDVDGVPADVVVLATGFEPSAGLAEAAGIELGPTGAIRTDEYMETDVSGIYAAGDCAETTHLVSGRPCYIPLGTTANKMGRIAGANAAGFRERFPGVAGTVIVRVCGLAVACTGLTASLARAEGLNTVSATIRAPERPSYFHGTDTTIELTAERGSGRLLGAVVIGEHGVAGRINVLATALQSRLDAEQLSSLDLAYAPPFARVWDPLLIAAQQLRKLLD